MHFYYRFFFKKYGVKSLIIKPILLTPNCISIGSNVFIRNNCRIEGVFRHQEKEFEPNIIIGDNVNIEQNAHITCTDSIYIGSNTSITANVTITDTVHVNTDISLSPLNQPLESKKIVIGSSCTIYNNSVILPGTELGNNVIVAANSVVCGRFPDFTIIGGNPARVIKAYNPQTKSWERV